MITPCIGGITKATNGEGWIERKSRLDCGSRFVQLPEPRQRRRQIKLREGRIAVCVEAPPQPDDSFGIGTKLRLRETDHCHPSVGTGVARRKAECLVNVSFSFCASSKKNLCASDESMSVGQITIQRQCVLALSDTLGPTFSEDLHHTQNHVSRSMVRRES